MDSETMYRVAYKQTWHLLVSSRSNGLREDLAQEMVMEIIKSATDDIRFASTIAFRKGLSYLMKLGVFKSPSRVDLRKEHQEHYLIEKRNNAEIPPDHSLDDRDHVRVLMSHLTNEQLDIIDRCAEGMSQAEIAKDLGMTTRQISLRLGEIRAYTKALAT